MLLPEIFNFHENNKKFPQFCQNSNKFLQLLRKQQHHHYLNEQLVIIRQNDIQANFETTKKKNTNSIQTF